MKENTQIYIDLDDVLSDTVGAYIELVDNEFGIHRDMEQIVEFNLQNSFGLTDEQNKHMFFLAHQREFTLNIKPFDDMLECLQGWKENGCQLAIVTGRHTSAYMDSLEWLQQQDVVYDSFTMVDKYGWKDTDHTIAISLDELKKRSYLFGVEDNPKMIEYLRTTMEQQVLLYDRPWNRKIKEGSGVIRCSHWGEVGKAAANLVL